MLAEEYLGLTLAKRVAMRQPILKLSSILLFFAATGCVQPLEDDGSPSSDRSDESGESAGNETWGCDGVAGNTINPARSYFTTSFGCWIDDNGNNRGDVDDNCIPWCEGNAGKHNAADEYKDLCGNKSGPQCERDVKWYMAGADRWGCASRLRVTNPDSGKAVVVVVLDQGPSCTIEKRVNHWVADLSYPTSYYLFGEPTSAVERQDVIIDPVPSNTPLGPVPGALPPASVNGCTSVLCGTEVAGDDNGVECYCDAGCEAFGDCCINRLDVCID